MGDWRDGAACAGAPLEWFCPPEGARTGTLRALEAMGRAVCADCAVRTECLTAAEDEPDRHTIRGGLTASERGWDAGRGQRKPTHDCDECGHPYARVRPSQRYCTASCAAKARVRRKRASERRIREARREVAV